MGKQQAAIRSNRGCTLRIADQFAATKVDLNSFTITLRSATTTATRADVTFYAVLAWVKGKCPAIGNEDPAAVLKLLHDIHDDSSNTDGETSSDSESSSGDSENAEREALVKMIEITASFLVATVYFSCERIGWETLECSVVKSVIRADRLCTQYASGANELRVLEAVLLWLRQKKTFKSSEGAEVSVKSCTSGEWCLGKVKSIGVGDGEQFTDVLVPSHSVSPLATVRYLSKDVLSPRLAKHSRELLVHVRFPFITAAHLKDTLTEEDLTLLKGFPVFPKLMVEVTNVQLGKHAAGGLVGSDQRAKKRARYGEVPEADLSMLVGSYLGA